MCEPIKISDADKRLQSVSSILHPAFCIQYPASYNRPSPIPVSIQKSSLTRVLRCKKTYNSRLDTMKKAAHPMRFQMGLKGPNRLLRHGAHPVKMAQNPSMEVQPCT
jgi:hypothetical protein